MTVRHIGDEPEESEADDWNRRKRRDYGRDFKRFWAKSTRSAGLQLLGLVAIYLILSFAKETIEAKPAQSRITTAKQGVQRKSGLFASVPHLKYVAILSAALVLSLTLIDYQFKVILRGTLQNEALAGFMGSFYGFSGLIALFVQLFISSRILTRFGVDLLFPEY
ncbi:hypothetical protein HQN89_16345 [Paenibacillus frigoriresistens]|uniref:hypothetical protein n=1 Tax=Paenibacillus alginolyticus TaxID=59839 RepID=UPI001566C928|nr:hypothetical protein [Paenibacillus frigoriresistens]NRF92566.1 hypothetical protein [Paenibacillus frigoriresistens]